jgi:hypothetical protein
VLAVASGRSHRGRRYLMSAAATRRSQRVQPQRARCHTCRRCGWTRTRWEGERWGALLARLQPDCLPAHAMRRSECDFMLILVSRRSCTIIHSHRREDVRAIGTGVLWRVANGHRALRTFEALSACSQSQHIPLAWCGTYLRYLPWLARIAVAGAGA